MPIKLLALDLDGTIVSNLSQISPHVQQTITAVMRQGIYVTLATGREYTVTAKFARQLKLNAPVISYQGGLLADHRSGKTWFEHTIPAEVSRAVIKFARRHKLPMLMYTATAPCTELPSPLMRHTFLERAQTGFDTVNNLLSVLSHHEAALKFVFIQPEAQTDAVFDLLQTQFNPQLTVIRSLETLVETILPHTSKGNALMRLAEHLNIPLADTMAIGDQDNDVSMLTAAGLGVAMGNASPQAKAAAAVVAPPLAEDGAAWAIERYILNGHPPA